MPGYINSSWKMTRSVPNLLQLVKSSNQMIPTAEVHAKEYYSKIHKHPPKCHLLQPNFNPLNEMITATEEPVWRSKSTTVHQGFTKSSSFFSPFSKRPWWWIQSYSSDWTGKDGMRSMWELICNETSAGPGCARPPLLAVRHSSPS